MNTALRMRVCGPLGPHSCFCCVSSNDTNGLGNQCAICSLLCKLLCPVICIVILGLLKSVFVVNVGVPYYWENEQNGFQITNDSISSKEWIQNAICSSYNETYVGYLGFSPNPSSNKHIQGVVDIMNSSWSYHWTDKQFEDFTKSNISVNCMSYAQHIPFKEGYLFRYFDSDEDITNFIHSVNYGQKQYNITPTAYIDESKPIATALSFNVNEDGTQWSYSIRGNVSDFLYVPNTAKIINDLFNNEHYKYEWNNYSNQYISGGFVQMQTFIDNSITKYIANLSNDDIDNIEKGYGIMPTNAIGYDYFWIYISSVQLIFFIVIQFIYPVWQTTTQLVHEKSCDKIQKDMKNAGITRLTYLMSCYLWLFIEFTVIALLWSIIGIVLNVFKYSDAGIIILWIELFCINFACFVILLSTLFDNPNIAAFISCSIYICVILAGQVLSHISSESTKSFLCIIGPTCFSISVHSLTQYESSLVGLQWDNIHQTYQHFKFQTCLLMLFFDCIIYMALTIYLDRVWPSKFRKSLHPLFFLTKSFWCPNQNLNQQMFLHDDLVNGDLVNDDLVNDDLVNDDLVNDDLVNDDLVNDDDNDMDENHNVDNLGSNSESETFFKLFVAVFSNRLFAAINDISLVCWHILVPIFFALIGLSIALTQSNNEPLKLEMSVNQWYSPNEYIIPISTATNVNQSKINNKFYDYIQFFSNNSQMSSVYGHLEPFEYENIYTHNAIKPVTNISASLSNYLNELYDKQRTENDIWHYNGFFIPEILDSDINNISTPQIYSIINVSAFHSIPITYNTLNNWILKYKSRNVSLPNSPQITTYNWPLPITASEKQMSITYVYTVCSVYLLLALIFIPIGAAYNIVNDKHAKLTKSVVSYGAYWCGNYMIDFILSVPTCLIIWILCHTLNVEIYLGESQSAFILLLLLFCLSILPFTYLLLKLVSFTYLSYLTIGILYIVLTCALPIISWVMNTKNVSTSFGRNFLIGMYKIFPPYLVSDSLSQLAVTSTIYGDNATPFNWKVTGQNLTILTIEAVSYFILLLIIEYCFSHKIYKTVMQKWRKKNNFINAHDLQMDNMGLQIHGNDNNDNNDKENINESL